VPSEDGMRSEGHGVEEMLKMERKENLGSEEHAHG